MANILPVKIPGAFGSGIIKRIFTAFWGIFLSKNRNKIPKDLVRTVIEAVNKMLGCGDPENGFAEYRCVTCGKGRRKVPFTCKSKFCVKCGKVYVDKWVNKEVGAIIEVAHRHIVFTIPEEFRSFIFWNRRLSKVLSDTAAKVMLEMIASHKEFKGVMPGIVAVVHTFGRDLKFNPHVHMLLTEGGFDRCKVWQNISFFCYEVLRKKWQYHLCKELRRCVKSRKRELNRIIDKLYQERKEGFYVHAERKMKSARDAARYIGRYLARPAIAEWRIEKFDDTEVVFWYKDHETGKKVQVIMEVERFIGRLISHIPPKSFKMVRKYGLYSVRLKKLTMRMWARARQLLFDFTDKVFSVRKSFRQRLIESFGKDVLKCPCCGSEMELWRIWHPEYGDIYEISRDAPAIEAYVKEEKAKKAGQKEKAQKEVRSEVFGQQYYSQLRLSFV